MKRGFLKLLPLLLLGSSAGFLNGLLGAGGGILVVFGLRAIFRKQRVDARSIYATAIAIMLPLSAFSALHYLKNGHLPDTFLAAVLFPALLGGICGALLLRLLSPKLLHRIFAAVVLVSGIVMVA